MIWLVIWVVFMIVWFCFGCYSFDRSQPHSLGGYLIPWICTLILGLVVFGAITVGPINPPLTR